MKKLIHIVFTLAMLFLLACSEQDEPKPVAEKSNDVMQITEQEALSVGITSQEVAIFNHSHTFRTRLKGEFEIPAVETEAKGISLFRYSQDTSALYFVLGVNHIEDVTAAHIHLAPPDENGPVVVPLFSGPVIEGPFAGVLNTGKITSEDLVGPLEGMTIPDLVKEIQMGNTYVNVHTLQYPSGEIRGQIR